jgi:hypothetical protein
VVLAVLVVAPTSASVNIFSIEDKDLSQASLADADLIQADESFSQFKNLGCSLVEKDIPLAENRSSRASLVTTAEGCGWGASIGPIWILENKSGKPRLVLYSGGYSIGLLPKAINGMRGISVNSEHSVTKYWFDGKVYVKGRK